MLPNRVAIGGGITAYDPPPLPPQLSVAPDALADAAAALARLDGMAETWGMLLNISQFSYLVARQEAVFSSAIEGTASTVSDVLRYEALEQVGPGGEADTREVLGYVYALDAVFASDLPISKRLIKLVHKSLLSTGGRGANKDPGEFRKVQVRIGGSSYADASYIPPPVPQMNAAMDALEIYVNDSKDHPIILAGLTHAQFEMIHPFLDGNGRVGRLLVLLILHRRGLLQYPLFNMSWYFKQYQTEYYERLRQISEAGNWDAWMAFYLRGVREVAGRSGGIIKALGSLQTRHGQLVDDQVASRFARPLLDLLFQAGWAHAPHVAQSIGCTAPTARALLDQFEALGIVEAVPGSRRPKIYRYPELLHLFR